MNPEIQALRRAEKQQDLCNRIGDFVAVELASENPIRDAAARRAIVAAQEKFRAELPDGMIAQLALASVRQEMARREEASRLPKPIRKDRFGRPIPQPGAVVKPPQTQRIA